MLDTEGEGDELPTLDVGAVTDAFATESADAHGVIVTIVYWIKNL